MPVEVVENEEHFFSSKRENTPTLTLNDIDNGAMMAREQP
jgi:hypothetical protein